MMMEKEDSNTSRKFSSVSSEGIIKKEKTTTVEDGRSQRRRVKTSRFDFDSMENDEQKILQQAISILICFSIIYLQSNNLLLF
jgi:hypothetical protein